MSDHEASAGGPASPATDSGPEDVMAEKKALYDPYEDYPEGGLKAWSVILGAFFCVFWTFGLANSFGVLQSFYSREYIPDRTQSDIAWIGALNYFFIYVMGLPCGRLLDLGLFKPTLAFGVVWWVFSMMMVSLSKTYWQLMLSQGVSLGISLGIVFNIACVIPTHWFSRRRAFSLGLQASGSSIGGTVLPIMVNKLIPLIGFGWTIRTLGFIGLFFLSFAWIIMETRLPPLFDVRNGGWKQVQWVDFSAFKTPSYVLFNAGAFALFLALYNPINYMNEFALAFNVPAADYMLSILNAGSTFGRVFPGLLADRIGRFNVAVATLAMASAIVWTWPTAHHLGGLIPFAILYGFASGAYVSIVPSCLAQLGSIRTIGTRTGQTFGVISIAGLVSTPIGGALIGNAPRPGIDRWWAITAFSGALATTGTVLLIISRQVATGNKWFVKF